MRIISVCRKTILSDSALPRVQRGIRIFSFCTRTTMKRRVEFGQPVFVQVRPEKCLFDFVTRQESIVGSSLAPNLSGGAMELYCIGSGLISRSTTRSGQRRPFAKVKKSFARWLIPFLR